MAPVAHPALPARLRRPWAVALFLVLAFVPLGAVGLYRYVDNYWLYRGFAPPHDPPFVVLHGRQEVISVTSAALGGRRQQVVVYLPPGYDGRPARRYPVLYLLHGFPGRPLAFLDTVQMGVVEDTLVTQRRAQPLILVMPFGSTGTFEDKEWANGIRRNEQWETFVARDVVAAIDTRYRTIPAAAARGLGGLSEGGYGALNIGLHHPGEFGVLESWSGYQVADPIPAIFGHSAAARAYNSPASYLPQVASTLRRNGIYVWFYSSSKDPLLAQNAAFAAQLTRYRVPHTFFVVPGGHTWVAWRDEAHAAYIAAASRLRYG